MNPKVLSYFQIFFLFLGISVILVGDLGQLPPVRDKVAYDIRRRAKILWEEFKIVVTLEKVYRQNGEDLEQTKFRQLLTNLRDAKPTIDDWRLLMSRTKSKILPSINEDFDNNVHLFSTNENVHNHNRYKLHSLKEPVARVIATNYQILVLLMEIQVMNLIWNC